MDCGRPAAAAVGKCVLCAALRSRAVRACCARAVSYTHLTLPTKA